MPAPTRTRRRLTRGEILEAAILLADSSGLASLTMRSLAAEISVDPTAVYRHFRDKQELLLAMLDLALEDLRYPEATGNWRLLARDLAISLREVLLSHPGLTMLVASGPPTSGTVAGTTRALALLQAAGVPLELAVRAHRSVVSFVVGWVLIEQGSDVAARRSDFAAAQELARLHPGVNAAAVAWAVAADRSAPGEFEFGLNLILDGLSVQLDEPARDGTRSAVCNGAAVLPAAGPEPGHPE